MAVTNKPPELPGQTPQVKLAFAQLWNYAKGLEKQLADAVKKMNALGARLIQQNTVIETIVLAPPAIPAPSTGPHEILSTTHDDTTPDTVVRGDIITGQGTTPAWKRLGITVPAAGLMNYVGAANGDTEPGYKALLDTTAPGTIAAGAVAAAGSATVAARRDHTHGAPSTWPATRKRIITPVNSYPYTILATDDLIVCT
jgi:hypothetical protein